MRFRIRIIAIFLILMKCSWLHSDSTDFHCEKEKNGYRHFLFGCFHYEANSFSSAEKEFSKALRIFPGNDYIRLKRCQAQIYQGKNEKAYSGLLQLNENPGSYACEAEILMASLSLAGKNEGQAIAHLNRALELNPKNKTLFITLSQLYEKLHLKDEIISTYLKATETFPHDPQFPIKLGQLFFQKGEYKKALSFFEEVFLKNPLNLSAIIGLGLCHQKLQDLPRTIEYFEKAIKIDPINDSLYKELIHLYSKTNQWEKAFKIHSQLLSIKPNNKEYTLLYAWLCLQSREHQKGIDFLEKNLALDPQNGWYMFWLGRLYNELEKYEIAENYYKQAQGFLDKKSELFYHYALLLRKQNREADAIKSLQAGINENPNHALSLNFLGYLLLETGYPVNEAIPYIERALIIEPENAAFLDSLAWALYKKGNHREALIYQRKAFSLSPTPIIEQHLKEIEKAIETDK